MYTRTVSFGQGTSWRSLKTSMLLAKRDDMSVVSANLSHDWKCYRGGDRIYSRDVSSVVSIACC